MRFIPARTAVCTAADIECDLPAPRPPRNSQHHDRSGGGSRAAKTQSSAASSPSPRIRSARNWCMRLTSRKKRSAIVVVPFHDFAIDDPIFPASSVIDKCADFPSLRVLSWPYVSRKERREGGRGLAQGHRAPPNRF